MNVVVIGGTGHIGTYLVPMLTDEGFSVTVVARGQSSPYATSSHWWENVAMRVADRGREPAKFVACVQDAKPDIVIDLIGYSLHETRTLTDQLDRELQHFLHCGTIWVNGPTVLSPTTEEAARKPIGAYGSQKAEIEAFLLDEAAAGRLPATVLHPGHLVGPGWIPINPVGNLNLEVFEALARARIVTLPNLGMETLNHVHAADVSTAFLNAISNREESVGEAFYVTASRAITMRGYAESVAEWFGQDPHLKFMPWETWAAEQTEEHREYTWSHIARSPNCSIAKARRLLGFEPAYSSLDAIYESLEWLIADQQLPSRSV